MAEYISREKAIETIQYRVCQGHGNKELICKRGSCAYCGIMEVMSDISRIEAADVQPVRHGRWFHINNDGIIYCSACENEAYWDTDYGQQLFDYCPYCGAKMIKDGDTE